MDIHRIYIGLPDHLVRKVHWVERKFRTNPKSYQPGGSDVIIEWHNGRIIGYDWIKYPSLYVKKIFKKELGISEVINLSTVKDEIASVFARKYKDEGEYSTSSFEEVWNWQNSKQFPWRSLEPFDLKDEPNPWEDFWDGLDKDAQANVLNVMES